MVQVTNDMKLTNSFLELQLLWKHQINLVHIQYQLPSIWYRWQTIWSWQIALWSYNYKTKLLLDFISHDGVTTDYDKYRKTSFTNRTKSFPQCHLSFLSINRQMIWSWKLALPRLQTLPIKHGNDSDQMHSFPFFHHLLIVPSTPCPIHFQPAISLFGTKLLDDVCCSWSTFSLSLVLVLCGLLKF